MFHPYLRYALYCSYIWPGNQVMPSTGLIYDLAIKWSYLWPGNQVMPSTGLIYMTGQSGCVLYWSYIWPGNQDVSSTGLIYDPAIKLCPLLVLYMTQQSSCVLYWSYIWPSNQAVSSTGLIYDLAIKPLYSEVVIYLWYVITTITAVGCIVYNMSFLRDKQHSLFEGQTQHSSILGQFLTRYQILKLAYVICIIMSGQKGFIIKWSD